jgi:dephospho-CoA kinase
MKTQTADFFKNGGELAFWDAPTLYESGGDKLCDKTVAVTAPEHVRIERIVRRDGIDENAARKRLAAQQPAEYYAARCDFLIDNASDVSALRIRVMEMLDKLVNGVSG